LMRLTCDHDVESPLGVVVNDFSGTNPLLHR
jgi:hypothetical protein